MSQRRNRSTSVGNINLGDNTTPSLTTMKSRPSSSKHKSERLAALALEDANDYTLVAKIGVALKELSTRYTWLPPLFILGLVWVMFLLSGNYTETNPLHQFVTLSYAIPGTEPQEYGKGLKDLSFVAFFIVFFTFFREFAMQMVLRPIAVNWFGITKEGKLNRFMEQTYSMLYYGTMGPFGLLVMKNYAPDLWYFNTDAFYENFPHKQHEFWFKFYYLFQASFWCQQSLILALQVEKPRKDFKELVLHHIVTILLIGLSYRFHFTWMGVAVYITMDVSDFFLATSKTLNYIDHWGTAPFFAVFVSVWIYMRHYLNLKILWSVLTTFKTIGLWELNWETQQYKCWISQPIVFILIAALQLVNAYWLFLIFRILYRIVFVGVVADVRSDEESEDKSDGEKKNE
ncbi:hypothetical protein BABINDRAFT_160578 [Babjeviella inositovora NRRL Y-12698]|uniref:TLC domain-containing protein n=1 Tax=Babjeviella inositovora NRRL Y-12698 TaxID=984486 RepID=A0A1E3QU16_9ASCO|nr:uncharacterized protein BABINDRAFT_160578 [Babjeviella inositovora NRRL Y-12698]ODQ81186.1 hypothetical protein BABINDRAFT_160578 [Babjeviella inositovora NRRL Y-12698]